MKSWPEGWPHEHHYSNCNVNLLNSDPSKCGAARAGGFVNVSNLEDHLRVPEMKTEHCEPYRTRNHSYLIPLAYKCPNGRPKPRWK